MKANLPSRAWLLPVLSLTALPALSQDLTLFQDDGNGFRGQFPQGGPPANVTAPSVPSMTVTGIYRFGDEYHVSIKNDQGAVYKATWKEGENGVNLNGYQIQVVESRTVTMTMPAGVSCQQNIQSGSNCVGRNQMALSIVESEPVQTRRGFGRGNNNNNNNVPNFGNDNGGRPNGGNTNIRSLFEAANNGDAEARAQLETLIGNRGRGRGGFTGGDSGGNNGGGFGGFNGGGNTGGRGGGNNGGRGGNNAQ